MDNNQELIQRAKELYSSQQYFEAAQICVQTMKNEEYFKESALLLAKSYVNLLQDPKDSSGIDTLVEILKQLIAEASSIEECFDIENQVMVELNDWQRNRIRKIVRNVKKHPETWVSVLDAKIGFPMLQFTVLMVTNKCMPENLLEASGLDIDAIAKQYRIEPDNDLKDEEVKDLLFDAAKSIFNRSKDYVLRNNRGSQDKILNLLGSPEYYNIGAHSKEMMAYCLTEDDKIVSNDFKKLSDYAHLLDFILDAKVYFDGKAMSFYMGDNRKEIQERLIDVYSAMKELRPDSFEIPNIPSYIKTTPPPAASGGCYVATAVYGSYDCPEVWTLRRFRDYQLAESALGRMFIKTYYCVSPHLVKWFGNTEWFNNIFKPVLNKLVLKLKENGVEDTPYNDRQW